MNENEVNPKRAIAIFCAVMILMVGGIFLGRHIVEGNDNSGDKTAMSETVSPSPAASPKPTPEMEIIYDGIVGIEPSTEPSSAPETESGTSETVAPSGTPTANTNTAPATTPATTPAPATGSTGGGTVTPVSTQTPATETTTAPAATPAPTTQTPADGSTNSEGQVYVPGFGWITPGSGNTQTVSHGNGGGSEQIGTMG